MLQGVQVLDALFENCGRNGAITLFNLGAEVAGHVAVAGDERLAVTTGEKHAGARGNTENVYVFSVITLKHSLPNVRHRHLAEHAAPVALSRRVYLPILAHHKSWCGTFVCIDSAPIPERRGQELKAVRKILRDRVEMVADAAAMAVASHVAVKQFLALAQRHLAHDRWGQALAVRVLPKTEPQPLCKPRLTADDEANQPPRLLGLGLGECPPKPAQACADFSLVLFFFLVNNNEGRPLCVEASFGDPDTRNPCGVPVATKDAGPSSNRSGCDSPIRLPRKPCEIFARQVKSLLDFPVHLRHHRMLVIVGSRELQPLFFYSVHRSGVFFVDGARRRLKLHSPVSFNSRHHFPNIHTLDRLPATKRQDLDAALKTRIILDLHRHIFSRLVGQGFKLLNAAAVFRGAPQFWVKQNSVPKKPLLHPLKGLLFVMLKRFSP